MLLWEWNVMKRTVFLSIIVAILVFGFYHTDELKLAFDSSSVKIEGEAAVVIDENTGKVLYKKNEHKQLYPASTTKLLTALVVLENVSVDELVTVGKEVYFKEEDEASVGLFEGQVQSVEELLAGMLLQSGNDAARSLAIFTAQKVSGQALPVEEAQKYFAQMMNAKAYEIGATDSNFVNPHGLHDPNHYSTAWDLALIAKAAKRNEIINRVVKQRSYSSQTHIYTNRNKLLNNDSEYYYEAATGLKTGFTDQAGYCLISSAEKEGKKLISVVLHSGEETVWTDSITLLDDGFKTGN